MPAGLIISAKARTGSRAGQITSMKARVNGGRAGLVVAMKARVVSSFVVDAGNDVTTDPYELVTVTATASLTPDTWTWNQTSGMPVTLTGTGATRTFVSPGTLNGGDIVLMVTAARGGSTPATSSVRVSVLPHSGFWAYNGTVLAPRRIWRLGDPAPLYPG